MKFRNVGSFRIIPLILLIFTLFISFHLTSERKIRRRSLLKTGTKFFQEVKTYFLGSVLEALMGKSFKPDMLEAKYYTKCIPSELKPKEIQPGTGNVQAETKSEQERSKTSENGFEIVFNTLRPIAIILKKIINFSIKIGAFGFGVTFSIDGIINKVCLFKGLAIKALTAGTRRRRLFILMRYQTIMKKKVHSKKKRGIINTIINKALTPLKPLLTKVGDFFKNLIYKIPLIGSILKAAECFMEQFKEIKEAILAFFNSMKELAKGLNGLLAILINTVCHWDTFKPALNNLLDAFIEKGAMRWKSLGKFLGFLVLAMGKPNKRGPQKWRR